MTLNDLIWHAHSHATAKEQEYQKALAERKEREAAEGKNQKADAQNKAVDNFQAPAPKPPADNAGTSFGPRLVMRDGKIEVDEQSLTIQV